MSETLFDNPVEESNPAAAPAPRPSSASAGARAPARPPAKANAPPAPPVQATKSGAAAGAPLKVVPPKVQSFVAWPKNVPAGEEALALLNGKLTDDAIISAVTGELLKELAAAEVAALKSPLKEEPALREGVVMRWRLAVVLAKQPALGSPYDVGALEKLLGEVDITLDNLPATEGASKDLQAALGSVRAALARDAITLSEFARSSRAAAAEAARAAARAATGNRPAVTQVTVERTADTGRSHRVTFLAVMTVVLALSAGFYHAIRLRDVPQFGQPAQGLPAGTAGGANTQTGIKVFRPADGKPFDSARLEQLHAEAKAKGMQLRELGNGYYMMSPDASQAGGGR